MGTPEEQEGKAGVLYKAVEAIVLVVLNLGAWGAAVVMLGLLSVGIWRLGHASWVFWLARTDAAGHAAMREAIGGFEFLLLAPLGYFLLLSLARYASKRRTGEHGRHAKAELLTVKALGAGLLVAVLAANLVGRLLSDAPVDVSLVLLECLGIGAIGLYSFVLEFLADRLEKSGAKGQ